MPSAYGGLEWPSTWNVSPGSFYIYKALAGFETRLGTGDTGHGLAHVWYRRTIQAGIELNANELDGYGSDGWLNSPFARGPLISGHSRAARNGNGAAGIGDPLAGFTTFGSVTQNAGAFTLNEQADVGLVREMVMPVGARSLWFRYRFTNHGDGDFLCVNFGGNRDLFFGMDMELSRDGPATCVEVPLEGLNAKSGPLVITLVSRGAANATAEISDVRLEISPDPDGDGLTTAEEQTLGTDALLADTDGDGLTDSDEVNNQRTDPLAAETDGDGQADAAELSAGTNPLQNGSGFRVRQVTRLPDGSLQLQWSSEAGKTYRVVKSNALDRLNFEVIAHGVAGVGNLRMHTDSESLTGRGFYWVEVE